MSNIRLGVVASTPEEGAKKMLAYLDSLPKKTEEELAWWRDHMAKVRSVWRPKPGDRRAIDPIADPEAAV